MKVQLGMNGVFVNYQGIWHYKVCCYHVRVVEIICVILVGELCKSVAIVTRFAHMFTFNVLSMQSPIDGLLLLVKLIEFLMDMELLVVILDVWFSMETGIMNNMCVNIV